MMCYRDRTYCEDACICAVRENNCSFKLTKEDGDRANALQVPIAWMSFKDTCPNYKEVNP